MKIKTRQYKPSLILISLTLFIFFTASNLNAASSIIIDFEGLPEGLVVTSLSSGNGISGDTVPGAVAVHGINPRVSSARNSAVIFDAACLPDGTPLGCTGDDDDLFKPELGNVLIVNMPARLNSAGLVPDPNDDDVPGMQLLFDFSGWGDGVVSVDSLDILDVEAEENEFGGHVDLYSGGPSGTLLGSITIPTTGNNEFATLPIGIVDADYMIITLNGSGAVDNIRISFEEEPEEPEEPTNPGTGTIGYWKNHPEAWPVDEIEMGGVIYTRDEAIDMMKQPVKGDKTRSLYTQLVAAKLNVLIGNDSSCVADTISSADAWLVSNPINSGVKASDSAWTNEASTLHETLDEYNNGNLCAPHRD